MGALNETYYNQWLSVKSVSSVCRFSFLLSSYGKGNNLILSDRRDARVVEWDGLENRFTRKGNEGSNPSLSAHLTTLSDRKISCAICRLGALTVAIFRTFVL
jgi:hypothetical protein